jgi:hypothetical protein
MSVKEAIGDGHGKVGLSMAEVDYEMLLVSKEDRDRS